MFVCQHLNNCLNIIRQLLYMLYPFQTVYTHAYIDKTFLMMAMIGGSDLDCPTIQPFHL